jgi:hypothetical protein
MNRLRTAIKARAARLWAWLTAPANSAHGGGWNTRGDDE